MTGLPPIFDGIEAVCFDAFGTLVEITDKRWAFVPLFRALPADRRLTLPKGNLAVAKFAGDYRSRLMQAFVHYEQYVAFNRNGRSHQRCAQSLAA